MNLRERQIANSKMRTIIEQCTANGITLKDLRDYWENVYVDNNTALSMARLGRRRKEIAVAAVKERWAKKQRFLDGDIEAKAKKEEIAEEIENPFSDEELDRMTAPSEIFE